MHIIQIRHPTRGQLAALRNPSGRQAHTNHTNRARHPMGSHETIAGEPPQAANNAKHDGDDDATT